MGNAKLRLRAWMGPFRPGSALGAVAAFALATASGCGGELSGGAAGAPQPRTGSRTSRGVVAASAYVPAAPSCTTLPAATSATGVPTHVSGYRVCGPFTATYGTASFDCPVLGGSGPYRLIVRNGAMEGGARTEQASILVDGAPVLSRSAFRHGPGAASSPVELASASRIDVEVADEGGLRVEVVDEGQRCAILGPIDVRDGEDGLGACSSQQGGLAYSFEASFATSNAFPEPELQLWNGGADDRRRAESAEVRLDGAPLVCGGEGDTRSPGDCRDSLGEHVTAVVLPVALRSPSSLAARAEDGAFTLQIVDRDALPPALAIDAPLDGGFTNQPQVAVGGAIDDPSATVLVNGASAAVSGGRFGAVVPLAACWNTISVQATDGCGNASAASVRIGLDTSAPVVGIAAPASGLLTSAKVQHVVVRFSDDFSGVLPSGVTATLDGADVTARLTVADGVAEGDVEVTEGAHVLQLRVTDRAGNPATAESTFTVDLTAPAVTLVAPADGAAGLASPVTVTVTYADGLAGLDLASFVVTVDGQAATSSFAPGPVSAAAALPLGPGSHVVEATIADLAGNVGSARASFGVVKKDAGPPDPAQVAPPNDLTVATDLARSTAFLYTGDAPIQTGVAPGTIEPQRVAVVRGQVSARDGSGLAGARVSVLDHPELGSTLTRGDGLFDLAVNGGGLLTVTFQKDGYLAAQRQVQVPWRDFAWTDPVVLVPFDTVVTEIQPGATAAQVARGSTVTDADGTRQATLVFPAGTAATMTLPDGSSAPLGTFHVRATEYTVGNTGRAAMPATLPPSSAYTYAVELTVDEAVMAGAREVAFSHPVPVYLENFLGIPVGAQVPAGYYDRARGVWVPSPDGRVIRILSTDGGVATVDADGVGSADDGPTLGISADEARQLAALYAPGQTVWRVAVPHFSAWDFNYAFGCEVDEDGNACAPPTGPEPRFGGNPDPRPNLTCGSVIDCQNQALGEDLPITGTEHHLSYRSLRQLGRTAERMITIQLPAKLPSKALGIAWDVQIAGQRFHGSTRSLPHDPVIVRWDGRDAYGRPYHGSAPVVVKLGFIYRPVYAMSVSGRVATFAGGTHGQSFGIFSREGDDDGMAAWATWRGTLAAETALPQGLGGWTLSAVHEYDPVARTLLRGDGTVQAARVVDSHVITTRAQTGWPAGIAVAPDGSAYTAEDWNVKKTDLSGRVTMVAGGGGCGEPQSGIPATQACLHSVYDLALGPDGSIYLAGDAGTFSSPVRRLRPDGIIEDVAGVPYPQRASAPVGDEGPALRARIGFVSGIAVAPDGSVYIVADDRIRRVSPDGIIHAFAGTGEPCFQGGGVGTCCHSGDDGPALQAQLCGGGNYSKVSVGPDGSVYLAEASFGVVRRIDPDGMIRRFAGNRSGQIPGDGGSALAAQLYSPICAVPGPDGAIYICDSSNKIRRVSQAGIIETVAGKDGAGSTGDGGPAAAATLRGPEGVGFSPDGDLIIADSFNGRVRVVGAPTPGFTLAEFTVASEDGSELYVFSPEGRHLRTLDARTKALVYTFDRDGAGRVVSITDRDGKTTRIERDGDRPLAIVAPYGQRTVLSVDANGYLSAVVSPAGEARGFAYDANGLMRTYTDPRGNVHAFFHDALGRLVRDENPAGGFKALARTEREKAYAVSIQTALGMTTVHDVARTTTGDEVRTSTWPDGSVTVERESPSGVQTFTHADGSATTITFGPDPQWGMQSRLATAVQVRTPAGLTLQGGRSAAVTLATSSDPLSVQARTDTLTVNGRSTRTTYDAAARTVTAVSAGGRTTRATLDDKGRVTQFAPPGVEPVAFQYDAAGRPWTVTQGARAVTLEYDGAGQVRTVTSAAGTTTFGYDLAGRVQSQVLPGDRAVSFGYDASGNLTALAPPGRPAHGFGYGANDQLRSYDPPAVAGSSATSTTYDLNLDGELVRELFPDSEDLVASWESDASGRSTGRLGAVTTRWGTTRFVYDGAGRVATVAGPAVELAYGWDGFLATTVTWTGEVNGTVAYGYDPDFRVAAVTVAGVTTARSYDADGLLTGSGALALAREAATGRLSGSTLGAVTTLQSYDRYGALATFSASVSGTEQYRYELAPDAAGRIATKRETIGGTTRVTEYGYDPAGRLWTVRQDGALTATYEYDENGNRLSATTAAGTASGTYDAQDRLLTYGDATYTWGANGELESRTVAGRKTWYVYDRLGNLRNVALPDGGGVEYVVDGLNRRVGRRVNGQLVEAFLYDGQLRPVAWIGALGAVKATFVYGTRVNVPEYMVAADGRTYRILTDHLGSPRLVVDAASGAVAQRMDYDEWGQVLADTSPGFQPFGFAGGLYDRDSGLVRFGARDYDPVVGRWTNKDPVRFLGDDADLYAYAGNDPLNRVDPVGEWGVGVTGGGSVEAGLIVGGGATGSIGGGVFWGGDNGVSLGGFASGGAFLGGPGFSISAPSCGNDKTGVLGGFAGLGAGLFLTNAKSATELSGYANTLSLNLGIGFAKFSLQLSASGSTWIVSLTIGPGGVASVSSYPTQTAAR